MFHLFILAFVAGVLVKFADSIEDKKGKKKSSLRFAIAAAYGILIGYLISQASFSMLFIGALLAQLLAGKIDALSHKIGFALALFSAFYFGFPGFDLLPLIVFLVLAYADELQLKGRLKIFTEYRLFLKLGALVFALLFSRWDYFFGILLFDIGYITTEFLFTKRF